MSVDDHRGAGADAAKDVAEKADDMTDRVSADRDTDRHDQAEVSTASDRSVSDRDQGQGPAPADR